MVQIHSPRPILLNQRLTTLAIKGKARRAPGIKPSVAGPYVLDASALFPLSAVHCKESFASLRVRFLGTVGTRSALWEEKGAVDASSPH